MSTNRSESVDSVSSIIEGLRDFAEFRFSAQMADERRMLPPSVLAELSKLGLFGLNISKQYGGLDLTSVQTCQVMEQVGAIDLSLGVLIGSHNGLGTWPIVKYAADDLKDAYLPACAAGHQLAGFALSEPDAGSNPMALTTTASKTSTGWLINGEKRWVGLGSWASLVTVFTRSSKGGAVGMPVYNAFLLRTDAKGLRIGAESQTMGLRMIVQNRLFFSDVAVDPTHQLGASGAGMRIAHATVNRSRLGLNAICIGLLKRSAQLMSRYARRRKVATGRLLDSPITLERLEDLTGAIAAVSAFTHAMAAKLDAGYDCADELFVAGKAIVPEVTFRFVDILLQTLGGRGYEENSGVPRMFRDSRLLRIFEGPTEPLLYSLGSIAFNRPNALVQIAKKTFDSSLATTDLAGSVAAVRAKLGSRIQVIEQSFFRLGYAAGLALMADAISPTACDLAKDWVAKQLQAALASLDLLSADSRLPEADAILSRVHAYNAQIGDIETNGAELERGIDPLLVRDLEDPRQNQNEVRSSTGATEIAQRIHDVLLYRLHEQGLIPSNQTQLSKTDSFTTLGVDSLLLASLSIEMQRILGYELQPEMLVELDSIEKIASFAAGES